LLESNFDDHYEEPEVKMIDKPNVAFSAPVSSKSTSKSSSGSNRSSNNTVYSTVSGHQYSYSHPPPATTVNQNSINSEGIYISSNKNNGQLTTQIHPILNLPPNYHTINSVCGGIYGTRANPSKLRNSNSRVDYVTRNNLDFTLNQQSTKY